MTRHLLLTVCLVESLAAVADYCPPGASASGGMRDIMLIYVMPQVWTPQQFMPYVAYLDKTQGDKPRDWFFDAFLLLSMMPTPSGGGYYQGNVNKADCEYFLDLVFRQDGYLAALETCVAQVGAALGQTERLCPVIIMIPYVDNKQEHFGDVDGDGRDESSTEEGGRAKILRWYVDLVRRRWAASQLPHLKLWGYYWMNEAIGPEDYAIVRTTADYVHSLGYGLHWIPWFRAPGFDHANELGIDFTVMQPNFAFIDVPQGAVVPDEGRLTENALLARQHGLGVEMEMHYSVASSPADQLNLQLYLNHGVEELDGYMTGAVRAWFQGHDLISRLYHSPHPTARQLYEDCYRFHTETYRRRAVSLCEGAPCALNSQDAPLLTDGLWLTQATQVGRTLTATYPVRVELSLGGSQLVGDVRVHLVTRRDAALPTAIRVLTSPDGQRFDPAADVVCPILMPLGDWRVGFALATFEPRLARSVRLELAGPTGDTVGLDEVVVFPAPGFLWELPCRVTGQLVAGLPEVAGAVLADGRLASGGGDGLALRFADGQGSVTYDLGEPHYLETVRAHARWPVDTQQPKCKLRLAGPKGTQETDWAAAPQTGDDWVELAVPFAPVRELTLELSGGAQVAWDEVQAVRAPNLAKGKPYRLTPPFKAKYPDTDDRELTDGQVTERGFSDGRTVGWISRQVTLLVDLGRLRDVDSVRVHTEGGGYAGVWHPQSLEVWVTQDGERWERVAGGEPQSEVTLSETVDDQRHELAWLTLRFAPAAARFVRIRLLPPAVWCWTMLSELQVLSGASNVAENCPYWVSPAPASEERYADTAGRLTDGDLSRPSDGWRKAVGWSEGQPEVIVDLLRPHPVSLVRVHCLGGGNGAVFFPREIGIATSLDSVTWTQEVQVADVPVETGDQSLVAYYDAALSWSPARYVRVRTQRKGWLMLDEVEVYEGKDRPG